MRRKLLYFHECPCCKKGFRTNSKKITYCNEVKCQEAKIEAHRLRNKKYMQDFNKRIRESLQPPKHKTTITKEPCRYCGKKTYSRFDVCPQCRERVLTGYTHDAILYNSFEHVNM